MEMESTGFPLNSLFCQITSNTENENNEGAL